MRGSLTNFDGGSHNDFDKQYLKLRAAKERYSKECTLRAIVSLQSLRYAFWAERMVCDV